MPKTRDNRIIRSRHFHRLQRRHFIAFDVLPFVGTLVALGLLAYRPIGALDLGLFFGMWLLTGLGVTVGYHRLFTHRAFSTGIVMGSILIVMGSMAGRGPMLSWVAMHRRHHELSDHEGDLHSPNLHGTSLFERLRGFLHAHLTWMIEHDYPNVAHYVPDLMSERRLVAVNSYYYSWVLLGLLIPAAIGGLASHSLWGAVTRLLWGGVVRMFVVEQSISAINSVLHTFGTRPFATRDDHSRNLGLVRLGRGMAQQSPCVPLFGGIRAALVRIRSGISVHTVIGSARARMECQGSKPREDRASHGAAWRARRGRSRTRLTIGLFKLPPS